MKSILILQSLALGEAGAIKSVLFHSPAERSLKIVAFQHVEEVPGDLECPLILRQTITLSIVLLILNKPSGGAVKLLGSLQS